MYLCNVSFVLLITEDDNFEIVWRDIPESAVRNPNHALLIHRYLFFLLFLISILFLNLLWY